MRRTYRSHLPEVWPLYRKLPSEWANKHREYGSNRQSDIYDVLHTHHTFRVNILPEHPVLPVEPVKKRIAKVLKWEKKAKLSAIVGEKETIREDEKCETIEIIEKDAIAAIVEEPSAKEDASEDSTDIVVKRGDSTVPLPEGERSPRRKASLKKKAKKSKRNKWLLAAAVGSSGYVDSFLNTDMSYGDVSSPGDSFPRS